MPETNDKGVDKTYANVPDTANQALQAGLGNCPTKSYSDIYKPGNIYNLNTPGCNNTPYNQNLPPLVGQSSSNWYDPRNWTGVGKEAWSVRRTDQATNNPYMFFKVEDGYMKGEGSGFYRATITVKYFDIGNDKFTIKYDSTTGEKPAFTVTKGNTKTLKTVAFTVNDARFANGLAGGSDFYLDSRDPVTNANDGNEWLHMVEVEKLGTDQNTPTPSPTATETTTPTATSTATPSTGTIEGKAYNDLNGNKKLDAGEPGVAGAVVMLTDNGDVEQYSATSDADGVYKLTGIQPGQYTLKEKSAPAGYSQSSFTPITLFVQANITLSNFNFGYTQLSTATPTVSPTPSNTPPAPLDKKVYLPIIVRP